ncbi:Rne/Rng family ribonuclease [bacterium]|nr:Rne/Rng family ribonuclease [bacterium]
MSRKMLINAAHSEECRVAIVEDGVLVELEVERADSGQMRGNIYKAPIMRIEPSLQAAFLDIGAERNGFLQINDVNPSYFKDGVPSNGNGHRQRVSMQDALTASQELVVQVVKDGRDAKGATLTTNLSLPGRYLVLMIGNQRGGVSRKISSESQRSKLRQAMELLKVPAGMGVIVRTAGINRSVQELERDLQNLLDAWYTIVEKSLDGPGPRILFRESTLALRTIRDYLTQDVEEIVIDETHVYQEVREFFDRNLPQSNVKIIHYQELQPLFSKYEIDSQVDTTLKSEVHLPSGGSIVINQTEAIVAIDVNSGRATGQADVEETAFRTNCEAAEMVARQLRLRDLGGLIVIDFIDMWDKRHKNTVEKILKQSLRSDKAKVEMGRISQFGLLEMSRQRLKTSLTIQSHVKCPQCQGAGRLKTHESSALEVLRKIQSAVFLGGVHQVRVRMNPSAALFLLNNKRQILSDFERATDTTILVIADGRLSPDDYEMELGGINREAAQPSETTPQQQAQRSPRGGYSPDRSRGDRRGDSRNRNSDRRRGGGGQGSGNNRRGGRDRTRRGGGQRRPYNNQYAGRSENQPGSDSYNREEVTDESKRDYPLTHGHAAENVAERIPERPTASENNESSESNYEAFLRAKATEE